jgi:hypothetical protein
LYTGCTPAAKLQSYTPRRGEFFSYFEVGFQLIKRVQFIKINRILQGFFPQ